MPEPRLTVGGEATMEAVDGDSRSVVTVREWIDGTPVGWHETADERAPAALLLTAGLARLHSVEWPSARPRSDFWVRSPGRDRWMELADRARNQHVPWAQGMAQAMTRLLAAEQVVSLPPQTERLRMCHLDPNPHNVMRTEDRIVLIDWDGAGLAPPEQEIASVIATWACDGAGMSMGGLPRRMLDAYRGAGGTFSTPDMGVFGLHLTGWLNWIELQMTIALGDRPDDPRDATAAHQSVSGLLIWARRIDGLPTLLRDLRSGG